MAIRYGLVRVPQLTHGFWDPPTVVELIFHLTQINVNPACSSDCATPTYVALVSE